MGIPPKRIDMLSRGLALVTLLLVAPAMSSAFDHRHPAWNSLLAQNVVWIDAGHASQVRYSSFAHEHVRLKAYLDSLSAVTRQEFDRWSKAERLAFLINAYNAFTIEKVLTRYPDLKSIRDFGTFVGNPWKDKFFTLLGAPMSLDGIEHDVIRRPGDYDEPRIHFALNCASVGCPALRDEAYIADRLDAQLQDQTRRFLSDRSRNRYVSASNTLEVSKIFDWYGGDFTRGNGNLATFFGRHAAELSGMPEELHAIRDGRPRIRFLAYDWALNNATK